MHGYVYNSSLKLSFPHSLLPCVRTEQGDRTHASHGSHALVEARLLCVTEVWVDGAARIPRNTVFKCCNGCTLTVVTWYGRTRLDTRRSIACAEDFGTW
eukprot:645025-Rhodomonas_salina.1